METGRLGTNPRLGGTAPGGWRWKGLSCGLVGIALLLVLAPAAQAATHGPVPITLKAPYVGSSSYVSTSVSAAGCGTAKIPHAPFFDATTGAGGFSLKAHAMACPPIYSDDGGASASVTVYVPIPAFTGNDVIHAKTSIQATLRAATGAATCALFNTTFSECYSSAYAELYGDAFLVDMTNGSYFIPDNYWGGAFAESSFYTYCYAGNCSSSTTGNVHLNVATSFVWTFHAHGLIASHSYVLELYWSGSASAYDDVYLASLSGASEAASVAMAGPGLGATLTSITIR
jgi:hypothetical protein